MRISDWSSDVCSSDLTSNGCNLHPGDLFGTGTLSGETETSFGSLLEISRGGTLPLTLPTGETRTFLEDGDELILSAFAQADRKSTRLHSSHSCASRMPSSAGKTNTTANQQYTTL